MLAGADGLKLDIRRFVWALVGSAAFTLALVCGSHLSVTNVDTIRFDLSSPLLVLAILAVLTIAGYWLLGVLESLETRQHHCERSFSVKRMLLIWALVFIAWVPVMLAYYPTVWAYDVMSQVPLETGGRFFELHPLVHTLYIQGFISLGQILGGGYELGMVLLSLTQMAIMSCIFAYVTEWLYAHGVHRVACVVLVAFFALMPFNSILSISQTKDVLFSGFGLLFFVMQYDLLEDPERPVWKYLLLCAVGTIVVLLRNNAIYVAVVWALISALAPGRRRRLRMTLAMVASVVLAIGINTCLGIALDSEKGPAEEAMSVPIQCMTRMAVEHDELVPEYGKNNLMYDDLVLRDEFPEAFAEIYNPYYADAPKAAWTRSGFKTGGCSRKEILLEWARLSARYPKESLEAWVTLTKGAWYPFDTSHAHLYDDNELDRQGYLLTDFKQFDGMDFTRPDSKLPWLEDALEKVATDCVQYENPVTALLFCPATYNWLLLFVVWLAAYRRRPLIPFLFLLLYAGTILLAPLIIVRYMYLVMLAAPVALSLEVFRVPADRGNAAHMARSE